MGRGKRDFPLPIVPREASTAETPEEERQLRSFASPFTFSLILTIVLYIVHVSIMQRSCNAKGGVAGESRLHSELFSTNQGYRYTKLHNRQ